MAIEGAQHVPASRWRLRVRSMSRPRAKLVVPALDDGLASARAAASETCRLVFMAMVEAPRPHPVPAVSSESRRNPRRSATAVRTIMRARRVAPSLGANSLSLERRGAAVGGHAIS